MLHNYGDSFPIKLDNYFSDYILAYNYLNKTYIPILDVIKARTPKYFLEGVNLSTSGKY